MDLPTITHEKILDVLTNEWQPIKSLMSKLKIKDKMAARTLEITLRDLESQKRVSRGSINRKKHWRLIISQIEMINEEIRYLKENLDFLNKLESLIKNKATGYELTYEVEKTRNHFLLFEEKMYRKVRVATYRDLESAFKEFRNSPFSIKDTDTDLKVSSRYIKSTLKNFKNEIKNQIGYLEFLKQKPEPKEIKERIEYEKDLDDFIGFLDEKYKEWEKIKSGKKD